MIKLLNQLIDTLEEVSKKNKLSISKNDFKSEKADFSEERDIAKNLELALKNIKESIKSCDIKKLCMGMYYLRSFSLDMSSDLSNSEQLTHRMIKKFSTKQAKQFNVLPEVGSFQPLATQKLNNHIIPETVSHLIRKGYTIIEKNDYKELYTPFKQLVAVYNKDTILDIPKTKKALDTALFLNQIWEFEDDEEE